MHQLTLQVGQLDDVVVDHGQRADAGGRERHNGRGPEATGADDRDVRGGEPSLSDLAERHEHVMPRGAFPLARRERGDGLDQGCQ
ncbi:hypothetical protein GCM10022202_03710 [Microbacterium marinilacus]|uniref:Uncharacterized protein n=1 Tax=Microbacterium marinilacus TaxID=415209 RepID=A0ABP7B2V8_9MICO